MDLYEGPTDIFGMAVYQGLTTKMDEDPKYRKYINNLKGKIVIDLDYYPIMIKFEKDNFEITREIEKSKPKLKISIQNFLGLSEGKSSMFGLFLSGKVKLNIKGYLNILKIYKIFNNMM